MKSNRKTLLIGLGNPILGDDGVGWHMVENVERTIADSKPELTNSVDVLYLTLGGLSLMELMEGYRDVIVADSILTGAQANGTVYRAKLSNLPNLSAGHTTAVHDTSLENALKLGRQMGMVLPEDVWIVAIEAEEVFDFSEELSSEIQAAVPTAVGLVLEILKKENIQEVIIKA